DRGRSDDAGRRERHAGRRRHPARVHAVPPGRVRAGGADGGRAVTPLDRYRGCLLGLAAGDALGTTLEFQAPGSFTPITDMVGGGPFHLKPGQWTDDTSMALCLAESLVTERGFDPV